MKYALTAVLLALSAAPADACKTDWLGLCRNDRILPPPAYDKPFPGLLVEDTAHDKQDMARLCAPHPKADQLLGCSSLRAFNDGSSATFTLRPSLSWISSELPLTLCPGMRSPTATVGPRIIRDKES